MAKCGYHPRMGVGLNEIAAGLSAAVQIKAQAHSRTTSDQLSVEKEEFSVVRDVVRKRMRQEPNAAERARLEAFDCMLFLGEFLLNLRNSTECHDLPSDVHHRADAFITFLKQFDDVWKHQLLDRPLVERAENALSSCLIHCSSAAA
jgi:hypothetical protein